MVPGMVIGKTAGGPRAEKEGGGRGTGRGGRGLTAEGGG